MRSALAKLRGLALICIVVAGVVAGAAAGGCGAPPRGSNHRHDGGDTGPAPHAPTLTWTDVAGLPGSGGGTYTSAALLDGSVYVLNSDYFIPEDALDIYDVAAGSWSTGPSLPTPSRLTPLALAAGGEVWIIGGYVGETAERLPDTYAFDPSASSWTLKAPMSIGRHEHMGAAVGDKLYVFGGHDGRSVSYENSGEVYDIASDTWSPIATMPHARKGGAAAVVDGKVFLMGGIDNDDYLRIIDIYDPASDTWSTADFALREARFSLAAAAVGSRIVVTGGEVYGGPDVGDVISTTVELLSPSESWSSYAEDLDVSMLDGVGLSIDDHSAFIVGNRNLRRVSL